MSSILATQAVSPSGRTRPSLRVRGVVVADTTTAALLRLLRRAHHAVGPGLGERRQCRARLVVPRGPAVVVLRLAVRKEPLPVCPGLAEALAGEPARPAGTPCGRQARMLGKVVKPAVIEGWLLCLRPAPVITVPRCVEVRCS